MYTITQEIYFCYGHRLINHPGKCRHVHGHSAKAVITVESKELNDSGMVCDFSEIEVVATEYINKTFDHNFILHKNDPLCSVLEQEHERFLAIDQHPTAEYLAKMIFNYMKNKGYCVKKVVLWETFNAYACYQDD